VSVSLGVTATLGTPRELFEFDSRELSLTYRLGLGTVGAEMIGSVVSVVSTEQATGLCGDVNGCGSYAFGDATAWQPPRRFEVAFRIESRGIGAVACAGASARNPPARTPCFRWAAGVLAH
jgi:hypothetical protein